MSRKIDGLVVTFKTEVSEEYADKIKAAISMFHHIVSVDLVEANHYERLHQESQAKCKVRDMLIKFIQEEL
jgi:hypothetical protein